MKLIFGYWFIWRNDFEKSAKNKTGSAIKIVAYLTTYSIKAESNRYKFANQHKANDGILKW